MTVACDQCGKPATCTGLYEGGRSALKCKRGECTPRLTLCSDSVDKPACDDCCDHVNSKLVGHCHKITQTEETLMTPDESTLNDARRYRRLRVLGVAPNETKHLTNGTVLCFTNLDEFVDADIVRMPSRGEAATETINTAAVEKHALEFFGELDKILSLAATQAEPHKIFDMRNELRRKLRDLFAEVRYNEAEEAAARIRKLIAGAIGR